MVSELHIKYGIIRSRIEQTFFATKLSGARLPLSSLNKYSVDRNRK